MRRTTDFFIIVVLFFCGVGTLYGQSLSDPDILEKVLYSHGFEQVHIREVGDSLEVFFEHRNFRNPKQSMEFATRIISDAGVDKSLVLIPSYHNQPMVAYNVGQGTFRRLAPEEWRYYKANNNKMAGYRFHFRIMPEVAARFGYYERPIQAKTNIIIDSRIYLLPGLSVQTGILIPVQNSLDNQDMLPKLAPSQLTFFKHWENDHFMMANIGTFFSNRYGADFQYRYAPVESRWSVGAGVAYTGFYYLQSSQFYMENPDDWMLIADVEYRTPIEDVSLKLSGGQFLYKDRGARLDVIKQFGNVDIGVFGALSKAGNTIGFQFAFPLYPGKILRGKKLELRTTEEFRWEYNYHNENSIVQGFRTGIPKLTDITRQYNGRFIRGY
ncbi:hypothetical protein DN752_21940 [Echinicola strongylocentroti]|uniref:Exopolysaccharide biosynthesis protein YbjH n=1 Tax=Echinicola strongylocentroti TaxID=1795355 RepID=A0A2Z4IP78_9BACT|nr:YjbH domain-containing protein [Echinicola strongylocentroti]AWW32594.1 hypothetical protein DN752_21940 [Echinicola strongylocentroti]